MKTVDIKGKDYVMVNERIKYFRENFEGYRLTSDIISMENGEITMKASVIDNQGNLVATGHASEKETNGFINKFSYVENCETSAWGRALANFGIGIDSSVASADEVANAIKNQTKKEPDRDFTEAIDKAITTEDLTSIWNSMTPSEQAKFKSQLSSKKQGIKEADPEGLIKSLRKDSKTHYMIQGIIEKHPDKEKLIKLYNEKCEKLGIDERYEETPFERTI